MNISTGFLEETANTVGAYVSAGENNLTGKSIPYLSGLTPSGQLKAWSEVEVF
jgi:hypothetical protein